MDTNKLYIEYARVISMCVGTSLEDTPWKCIRIDGQSIHGEHPGFRLQPNRFTFAVAILEERPVFVGDEIYRKADGELLTVTDIDRLSNGSRLIQTNKFTWQPTAPKRTFKLNGAELPCPISVKGKYRLEIRRFINERQADIISFSFEDETASKDNMSAFSELLFQARDL